MIRLFAAVALLTAVISAQQPYTIGSVSSPGGSLRSVGAAAAPAGDVDLDGNQDVLIGFPYNDSDTQDIFSDGEVFPAVGGTSGFHVWSPATGTFLRTIVEPGFATRGFALVNLGDIDGDGKPDHAASNPLYNVPGANYAGRVDAYSGATGAVIWSFVSTVPGGQAGISLARIADVDVDGAPDVLVGAPGLNGIPGRVFVISATTGALLRTHVGTNGDALGYATSDAGDLNGDGVSEYAAGAPQVNIIGANQPAGYVRIWSGATGILIRTVNGAALNDRFGRALAKAGDLDGDTYTDLLVGAPGRFNVGSPGRVYAISGASGLVLLNTTRNVAGDRFGWSLCAVGDRNGDGKTDFAAGTAVGVVEIRSGAFGGVLATQSGLLTQAAANGIVMRPYDFGDVNNDGVVDVAIGSPTSGENGLLAVFTSVVPSASLAGNDGHNFPSGVAALGDLDGDGIRDLAIGSTDMNTQGLWNAGGVTLWSTGASAPIAQLTGTATQSGFGFSVSTLDDVDNDGVEDFLVSTLYPGPGSVTCYSGATRVPIYTTTGTVASGAFGYFVTRLSDLNGDGKREFAAGAPYANAGAGTNSGQVHICSGATGAILSTTNGPTSGEALGWTIAEVGDINGDGKADLIAGAPYGSGPGGAYAGFARLISGATGAILRTHAGTASGIALGAGVCRHDDLDNDGVSDYAISSPASTASSAATSGPVVIYSGLTGLALRSIGPSPIPPGYSVNDTFGIGLCNAGDLDGDGWSDILLGAAPWIGAQPVHSREIHAYSGLNGALIVRQIASGGFTPFAPARNTAGFDVTGDGVADWVAYEYPSAPTASSVRIMSRAGIPAGSATVGTGCNLGTGLPPVLQTGGGPLVSAAGAPLFELLVSRAAPNQSGVLAVGASSSIFNGLPLPLDLTSFGLPGCFLYNSADVLIPFVATPGGLFGLPTPLPANPTLAGATAHLQAFLVNAMGAVVTSSNGLTLIVQ